MSLSYHPLGLVDVSIRIIAVHRLHVLLILTVLL
jgi:hypothetical protein